MRTSTILKEIYRRGAHQLKAGEKYNNLDTFYKYGYENCFDCKDYKILSPKVISNTILAILDNTIVIGNLQKNPNTIYLYPDYNIRAIRYKIQLNKKNFMGLIDGSKISRVLLLKYLRQITPYTKSKSYRLIIITNKGQIYHNFPARAKDCDGNAFYEDIINFEESVVWDLPERKYPSNNKIHEEYEMYYPNLPNSCYEYYPIDNNDKNYVDKYGNGGFGKYIELERSGLKIKTPRFYMPIRKTESNSFEYMGGIENDYQTTVLGTYKSAITVGTRICIFMSDDGGRQWFCKYEFGDSGDYEFVKKESGRKVLNLGNPINFNNDIKSENCYVNKRKISKDNSSFEWDIPIKIDKFNKGCPCIITTTEKHLLNDSDIIAITGDYKDWFISKNLDCNDLETTRLFKVKIIDNKSFELYEFVANTMNPICCRHIHHINRNKNGYIVGTGEIYPNGWILNIPCLEGDYFPKTWGIAKKEIKIQRINKSPKGVQRTMGLILMDSGEIIFASDYSQLKREIIEVNSNIIEKSSTGVYSGNIKDIDNLDKFKCIYESNEVAYFFKKINGTLIFGGQLGELAFSKDNGITWVSTRIRKTLQHMQGVFYNGCLIDGYIIVFK